MFVEINGIKINYIDTVDSIDNTFSILLLHGWGADIRYFNRTIETLKKKYRVLAIDLPGFGLSGELKRSFNVDDYCDIVVKFLEHLKIKNVVLLGHSYGGRIIIKLNSRELENINIVKNVLIDSAGIKHKLSFVKRVKVIVYKVLKSVINIIPSKKIRENCLDSLKKKFGSSDYKNATKFLRETMVKSISEDLTPYLKNIKKETLLVWGDKDIDTPITDAKIMEREIENSGLVILKNTSHFSFLQDEYTYIKVLESFFNL